MIRNFHAAVAALRADIRNPLIALVVSDEAATYRPEMEWLAEQLQRLGKRVFCLSPDDVFPLGTALCFDMEGNPEKIDIIYRFFELFDLERIPTAHYFFESWAAGEVTITPPMRPFQEEKLGLALFHHHLLQDYWAEASEREDAGASARADPGLLGGGCGAFAAGGDVGRADGGRAGAQRLARAGGGLEEGARIDPENIWVSRDGVGGAERGVWRGLLARGMAGGGGYRGGGCAAESARAFKFTGSRGGRRMRSIRRRAARRHRSWGGCGSVPVFFRARRQGGAERGAGDLLSAGQKDHPRHAGRCAFTLRDKSEIRMTKSE